MSRAEAHELHEHERHHAREQDTGECHEIGLQPARGHQPGEELLAVLDPDRVEEERETEGADDRCRGRRRCEPSDRQSDEQHRADAK